MSELKDAPVVPLPSGGAWFRAQVYVSSMSIRYKIAGALITVLCLAIASLGVVSFRQLERVIREELQTRSEVLARQLAATGKTGLLTKDELSVYATIKDLQKLPGVRYAIVQDSRGRVFSHSDAGKKGKPLEGEADVAAVEAEDLIFQQVDAEGEVDLEAAVPITSRYGSKTLRVGTARVGVSQLRLNDALRRQKLSYVLVTGAYVLLGLLISFALGKLLTRQIVVLMGGMKVVSQGNFTQLIEVQARDEIGKLAESFNAMILNLREKLHMEKYLSRSTLQLIKRLRDEDHMKLGGERKEVTVLFSDIRGFTAMTETLDAEEVVDMLNIYLNLQAEVVSARGGVVDKFVGDEVMALFTDQDAAFRAALAAQEIRNYIETLNEARRAGGKHAMWVGIGLNSGPVIMGNMGSERQMNFTVIGDAINTAARLCAKAEPSQIVMSRAVAKALGARGKTRGLEPMLLKGKREPFEVLELLDVPGAARRHMRKKVDLKGICRLSGLDDQYSIRVVEIGQGGCTMQLGFPVGTGTKIELELPLECLGGTARLQAVVKEVRREGPNLEAGAAFEGLPEKARHAITEWVHEVVSEVKPEAVPGPEAPPPPP